MQAGCYQRAVAGVPALVTTGYLHFLVTRYGEGSGTSKANTGAGLRATHVLLGQRVRRFESGRTGADLLPGVTKNSTAVANHADPLRDWASGAIISTHSSLRASTASIRILRRNQGETGPLHSQATDPRRQGFTPCSSVSSVVKVLGFSKSAPEKIADGLFHDRTADLGDRLG
jgi:hypothetical protein